MGELGSVAWPPSPIRTPRLLLREPVAADRARFIELSASPQVQAYLGRARSRDELERTVPTVSSDHPGVFVVEREGVAVGVVTVDRRDAARPGHVRPGGDEPELGYLFLPQHWGSGFAGEACTAVLEWCAGALPGEPLVLCTQTANERSLRLAVRLGFTEVERFMEFDAEQWFGVWQPTTAARLPDMASIHHTTLVPSKLELLTAWLPSQPWYVATTGPELTKAGGFRLDDPAGEVGIEVLLVAGSDGTRYLVPMTYRGAPLDGGEAGLIGTSEHGVLGRRWIYDAVHDPVAVTQLVALLSGRCQAQHQDISDSLDTTVEVVGTVTATLHPRLPLEVRDDEEGTLVRLEPGAFALHLLRRLDGSRGEPAGLVLASLVKRLPGAGACELVRVTDDRS